MLISERHWARTGRGFEMDSKPETSMAAATRCWKGMQETNAAACEIRYK